MCRSVGAGVPIGLRGAEAIVDRLDVIDPEMEKLTKERSDLDAELTTYAAPEAQNSWVELLID
jgi:hypothetical protein